MHGDGALGDASDMVGYPLNLYDRWDAKERWKIVALALLEKRPHGEFEVEALSRIGCVHSCKAGSMANVACEISRDVLRLGSTCCVVWCCIINARARIQSAKGPALEQYSAI